MEYTKYILMSDKIKSYLESSNVSINEINASTSFRDEFIARYKAIDIGIANGKNCDEVNLEKLKKINELYKFIGNADLTKETFTLEDVESISSILNNISETLWHNNQTDLGKNIVANIEGYDEYTPQFAAETYAMLAEQVYDNIMNKITLKLELSDFIEFLFSNFDPALEDVFLPYNSNSEYISKCRSAEAILMGKMESGGALSTGEKRILKDFCISNIHATQYYRAQEHDRLSEIDDMSYSEVQEELSVYDKEIKKYEDVLEKLNVKIKIKDQQTI